ncbi:hypothetical protein CPB84DRAFT_1853941 [Gymnopilus junonius]|uniref:Uncharacterized protein n=1 Tax=Gymnopilus junonius TaxID=109634 RepID=A0A9P5TGJ8_GYMJU|nr:hypothetical protein CPB84DRAFT_1853941 [Gymnopilus junonius]
MSGGNGPQLPFIDQTGQVALLWVSIGLVVITFFWQGLIVTVITIAEDQGMWTFHFHIACYEHWWWSIVSTMLASSFILIVFSFLAGNSSNSLGILTLSTATAISIICYAIPAWRNCSYIELCWLSWTGPSDTGIPSVYGKFCRTMTNWRWLQKINSQQSIMQMSSDEWGWTIKCPIGIAQNLIALFDSLDEKMISSKVESNGLLGPSVYDDGVINSMPSSLLKSIPSTYDGFNRTGLCMMMDILGWNKGLAPYELVFDVQDKRKAARGITRSNPNYKVTTELEATSAWFPHPNKVMPSFYQKSMEEQYSGLGPEFLSVAVELVLIFLDCPHHAVT